MCNSFFFAMYSDDIALETEIYKKTSNNKWLFNEMKRKKRNPYWKLRFQWNRKHWFHNFSLLHQPICHTLTQIQKWKRRKKKHRNRTHTELREYQLWYKYCIVALARLNKKWNQTLLLLLLFRIISSLCRFLHATFNKLLHRSNWYKPKHTLSIWIIHYYYLFLYWIFLFVGFNNCESK